MNRSEKCRWRALGLVLAVAACGQDGVNPLAPQHEPAGAPMAVESAGEEADPGDSPSGTDEVSSISDRLTALANGYGTYGVNHGVNLQRRAMMRAAGLAPQNRPYVFDGIQDCWGYVRQVWNALLSDGNTHGGDYSPTCAVTQGGTTEFVNGRSDRRFWLTLSGGMRVADAPSADWLPITDPNILAPGDALSTAQ